MKSIMIKLLRRANPKILKGIALVRLDFNTEDNWRIAAVIPTLKFLIRHATKVVIISHRGRPPEFKKGFYGAPAGDAKQFSLRADSLALKKLIKKNVHFITHFDFGAIKKEINDAPQKSVFLLENLRFMAGESGNDNRFAKKLSSVADYYVNEAFAVSHRAHASVSAITRYLPSYAGFELEHEIVSLSRAMDNPRQPLVLLLGGGKASDKLGILKYFKNKADYFLLGGVPANTILFLKGVDVKNSIVEKDAAELKKLKDIVRYKNILLPADFAWGDGKILDIGKRTELYFSKIVGRARTIIWSGPLGFFEKKPFDEGSIAVARAILRNKKVFSIAGGGETVAFLKKHGFDKKFGFISTGGGAMLEFLEGKKLPGIAALEGEPRRGREALKRSSVS